MVAFPFQDGSSVDIFLSLCTYGFISGICLSLFGSHLSFIWCIGKTVFVIVAFPGYLHIFSYVCFVPNLFVLRFYGPVNPMGSCRARSVYLTTRLLGRLSPLSS